MRSVALLAALPAAVASAQSFQWVNYESTAALESTGYASSAVRDAGIGSYRIAADDFALDGETTLSRITFYSVEIDPCIILGGDWYIYEFDDATSMPGKLITGAHDVVLDRTDSGLASSTFGVIYRNDMEVDVTLPPGKYFLAFRTHCGAAPGKPVNAPLHPEWTNGNATAMWNFGVLEDGTVTEAWVPMTTFHPTEKEWAFEIEGDSGGCYADCDHSGALDFFDFLCFQNAFGVGDPAADCDGTGVLDFFDFLCFQNEFAMGCP
ncbi:MAG: hypothetical protein ACF8R7_15085 [Phycisphaerales bacterium JB039]